MTRSVTFGGNTQFKPGGLSKVNASALAQVGLSSSGIIGLIGEADGGAPNEVIQIDDPALASTFRSGPLADAIRLAFDPSDDPRVPGGAFRCLCVKTNQSTQSTLVLYQEVGTDTASGVPTTTNVPVTAASMDANEHVGNYMRVTFASGLVETRPITANGTGDLTTTTDFTVAPASGDGVEILAPQMTVTTKDYGVHTAQTLFEFESGVSTGSHWTTTLDGASQLSGDVGGKSFIEIEYVGNSQQYVHASGTAASAGPGSATTLEDTGATFPTAGDGLDRYFVYADDSDNLSTPNLREIASNTGIELTVTNAFSENPYAAGGTVYSVRSGEILSFGAGVGKDSGATTAWAAGSVTLHATDLHLALNELAGMILVITGGTGAGQKRSITGNTAGLASVISVDENWITTPDATSEFDVRYTTIADATVVGAAGVATSLTSRKQENQANTPSADLDITITATMTLSDLVATIDADSNYAAWVTSGANGNLLASTLDYGGPEAAGVAAAGNAQYVDLRNDRNAVTSPPSGSTDPVVQWPNHLRRDLALIVDNINDISELLTCTRSTGAGTGSGSSRPEFQSGTAGTAGETTGEYLTGGTLGTSQPSNWQAAFDLLLQERMQHIVPLIVEDLTGQSGSYASIAAQLASHVSTAAGSGKNEQGGYIGYKGNLSGYVTRCNAYNNTDVQVTSQTVQALDVDGNLATMDEWSTAVIAAGMRAGMNEVGEPLTHKFFRTSLLAQDSSWDPADITDANLLIQNGALFAETIEGKGTRWVRDLTTYVQDDNLAYAEGSVRDVVRFTAYELRTFLEDRFTGIKNSPATVTSIKQGASELLEVLRSNNIIVDSTDANGNAVRAYHNLRVTISGDIATIRVSIFPAVGINFQLTELFLQLPTQAAA
jgi:hypothetical protein